MTISDIYDQTIKPLPADERMKLAKLIIDNLTPDLAEVRDLAHLEELLLAGLDSGEGIEADATYWEQKRQRLLNGELGSKTH